MHRLLGFLLLLTPLSCLQTLSSNQFSAEATQPLQIWNRDNLPWGTVLIWTERTTGNSLTTGVLINKARRWVLATRHALDNAQPDRPSTGISDTVYVVWPAAEPESSQVLKTSDHYFRQRRSGQLQPARVLAEDAARDIVLLQAGTPPPERCQEIPLETGSVPPG
ncbi:MAG TPA: hypothetical protein PKD72_07885, partial [Gemmatales bacterium]|nr:hypothetical protein [Gemmatales bacterium]